MFCINVIYFSSSSSVLTEHSSLAVAMTAGLPDGFFQTKNPNLGKFLRPSNKKTVIYFMAIWNISQIFWIFYDHLVHFVLIWYIFSGFGILCQKNLATLHDCYDIYGHDSTIFSTSGRVLNCLGLI
jgi:hypothetical protein